jgi:hypothetical protein
VQVPHHLIPTDMHTGVSSDLVNTPCRI